MFNSSKSVENYISLTILYDLKITSTLQSLTESHYDYSNHLDF